MRSEGPHAVFELQPEPLIAQMGKLRPREFRAERGLKADLQTLGANFAIFLLPGLPLPLTWSYSPTMRGSRQPLAPPCTSVSLSTDEGGWSRCTLSAHPALTVCSWKTCAHLASLTPTTRPLVRLNPHLSEPFDPVSSIPTLPSGPDSCRPLCHGYVFSPDGVGLAQRGGCDLQNYNRDIFLTCKSDYATPPFKSSTDSPSPQGQVQKP